jgi:hypothetical protein
MARRVTGRAPTARIRVRSIPPSFDIQRPEKFAS